jgi:hypothetical protein
MTRLSTLLISVFALGALVPAQQPPVQNGRVETRRAASLDRDVATLAAGATDPIWIGWRVPIVDGERGGCNTWINQTEIGRGMRLDYEPAGSTRVSLDPPKLAPPTGPVPIEAGTGLVILLRLVDGRVERMRTLGDDCPIDAGGRTMYWMEAVSAADSLRLLDGFTRMDAAERLSANARRSLADEALMAIALHRDAAADALLDRIATSDSDSDLRQRATSSLGSTRGAHGFATLQRLLAAERLPDTRRQLTTAIGQTREPGTVAALRALAHDADPRVRAAAVYYFVLRGGPPVVPEVTTMLESDVDTAVVQRAVSGLARLPNDTSVPLLIQIARTSKNTAARKQAVSALGQSSDPRAVAYIQEILK